MVKNTFVVVILALLFFAFPPCVFSQQTPYHCIVQGKVTCQNIGVANVPVTDGISFVYTNGRGEYTLQTSSDQTFVYYTLPSGYESPITEGVPVFYKKISFENGNPFVANFELQKSAYSQENHAFIVWADPQVKELEEFELLQRVVADMQKTIAQYSPTMPVHAISCGDNVFDELHFFKPYKKIIAPLNIPFYHAIGNHDLDYNYRSHELSTISYSAHFGPVHYSFNRGKIHYVVLNDVFYFGYLHHYMGYIGENQLQWLEQDLKSVPIGSTVVVSVHIPTTYGDEKEPKSNTSLATNSVMNKDALYKILSPYKTHVMAGHSHTQWNTILSPSSIEHTHAAACAAWWQGEIGLDGTPKGYTVYLAQGNNLTWYFKGVGMSKESQFKVYPQGSDPTQPEYIIANVFNYDPCWKVYWIENGQKMGEMERYWGEDPTAKKLYQRGKNKKYNWLNVGETYHLFRAKPYDPKAEISILVIDRFGNQYKQEVLKTE